MRYTEKDIPKINIYKLLEAIGMKHVDIVSDDVLLYYTPYRNDPEPKFLVDDLARKWLDKATGKTGDIRDLARLIAKGADKDDIDGFIVRKVNEYEKTKELLAMSRRQTEPEIIDIDYCKISLTFFMRALGQSEPLVTDGDIFYYKAPYSNDSTHTMAINTCTNSWYDTRTKAQGNIFGLVHRMIGSSNLSDIKRYIVAEISAMSKTSVMKRNEPKITEFPKKEKRFTLMNIDAIRQIPLVDFLNHLGYQPTGRDSKGLWFYSPYRNERKPSFHVNPRKNLWYDFGSGAGGDIFNLAGELTGETDFIKRAEFIAQKMQLPVEKPYKPMSFMEEPTFENVEISRLEAPALLKYLSDRGIPRDIAQRYCVQVDYELHGKRYYAIGFENNAHGYELRSVFFKGSYPPKHITHVDNGNARCNVFEGFIDFLSAERLGYNDGTDTIVLNSVSNLNKAIATLREYSVVSCYLDNDNAGRAAVVKLQQELGDKVMDKSALYPNHKDLNDYLMSLYPKQTTKSKLKL